MNLVRPISQFLGARSNWLAPASILTAGLILRLYNVNLGLLESAPNRQLIDAVWARNIYQGKFVSDFLQGFQLYHWIVAFFYYLGGGVQEIYGRLVSVGFSFVGAVYFYKLIKLYLNRGGAIMGLFFFFVLSPIHIVISRAFQVDMMALTMGIMSIYYLALWQIKNKVKYFYLSATLISLSLLTKVTFIYLLLPLGFIMYLKLKKNIFKNIAVYVYMAIWLIPVTIWYEFSRRITFQNPEYNPVTSYWQISNWFMWQRLFQLKFYVNNFYYFITSVTTPVGSVILFLSLVYKLQKKLLVFYIWFFSAWLYIVYLGKVTISHEYYVLVLVPPTSVLMAAFLEKPTDTNLP